MGVARRWTVPPATPRLGGHRVLDGKSRTMPVELDVMNGDGALAPGMYAEVTLAGPAK